MSTTIRSAHPGASPHVRDARLNRAVAIDAIVDAVAAIGIVFACASSAIAMAWFIGVLP